MNEEGRKIGIIHQVQENGKAIQEARKGMQVAVSIKGPLSEDKSTKGIFSILI